MSPLLTKIYMMLWNDKHLFYDLRHTNHYTYQLGSDNQWHLTK